MQYNSLKIFWWIVAATTSIPAYGQMIVAHRGASFDAPENTMSAFNLAWTQNADGIEGDFYLSKDGKIVCIHDATTKRTAGTDITVATSTLSELRSLEYGKWKGEQFAGEPIPTFSEVLKSIPTGKKFIIELKVGPEIVEPLAQQLAEHLPQSSINRDQLLIISFNADTIRQAKTILPEIKAHWLTGFKQDAGTGQWKPTQEQVVSAWKSSRADGIGFNGKRDILNIQYIKNLADVGCREFHVWTIDDPRDARYFRDLGAMGITTNRPQFIRDQL